MEEKNKAVIGGILFLLLILCIGVGGYIYTFKNNKHKEIINKTDVITDEYKNYIDFIHIGFPEEWKDYLNK